MMRGLGSALLFVALAILLAWDRLALPARGWSDASEVLERTGARLLPGSGPSRTVKVPFVAEHWQIRLQRSREGPRWELRLEGSPLELPSLLVQLGAETWVVGDASWAAALVDGRLRGLGEAQLQLGPASSVGLGVSELGQLAPALAALVAIGQRLERSAELERLLEETAFTDADPAARAAAAEQLIIRAPGHAAALARDHAPEVRLAVALRASKPTSFALASEILSSEMFRPELQQSALRLLLSRFPAAEVVPTLVSALATADDNLTGAIVSALGQLGHEEASAALESQLATTPMANAARIADALARLRGAAAEPTLLGLLARLPATGPRWPDERELAIACADGLGRIGSSAALPALNRLRKAVSAEGPVGVASEVAIELIRARTGGDALRGALSLETEGAVGHLSPTPVVD